MGNSNEGDKMAYTSGRTVNSSGRKTDAGLTVAKATREARRVVDKVMSDANATVDSRLGYDLATDTPTMVTTITFPEGQPGRHTLYARITLLPGYLARIGDSARIVITRKR
jgi:hypothetical protein